MLTGHLLLSVKKKKLKLKDGRFCLNRKIIDKGGTEAAKKTFENFYIEKGTGRLNERIARFAPKIGVKPTQCVVKELGYRWASCSASNALSFHWKCMMAPVKIIDYIVVHELCHLHQRDHSDAFWNEVDKVMPDYLERKEWLKRYGAGLNL